MALLRIQDLPDQAAQLAAEAAIHRLDPQASLLTDWRISVVEVMGPVPADALCAALRMAGFRVELLVHRPRRIGPADFLMLVLQVAGLAVVGAVAGTILGGALGSLYVRANPVCESVTDGGACTAIVFTVSLGTAIIMGLATGLATLFIGGMRLSYIHRTGEDVPFLRL